MSWIRKLPTVGTMKIVLPYNTHFGEYNSDIIVGGIEKFCHQIVENFPNVEIINIDNNEPIKENTTKIKNFARSVDADIIISNWNQASFSGSKMLDSEIPIMYVGHGHVNMGSILSTIDNLRNKNHSVYFVSQYQYDWYRSMSKRMRGKDFFIDGYINSSYVDGDKPKLLPIEYDCATIGRCDPVEKKPFIMKQWLKDTDYKSILLTNSPPNEQCEKYYNKNSHWDGVLMNLKHSDVMKTLSKSMTYFSTCHNETWGITALESLSHGVPIILNSKNNKHASTSICASDNHYKLVSDKFELIDAIKSFSNVDRKEIQDMTWEKHSKESWISQMNKCMWDTIDKFKRSTVMDFVV